MNPNDPTPATEPCLKLWRRLIGLALLLCAGVAAFAQSAAATGTITGRVLNEATGEYLRSATVSVVGTNLSTVAGAGGVYQLTGVPAGEARLMVSYTDLDPLETSVKVGAGETVNRDLNLTSSRYARDPSIVKLATFVVTSEREGNAKAIQEQRVSLDSKNIVASDAFGDVSEGNVGEFLKLMPGVMMEYVEGDVRSASIGGLGTQYTTVLMDGARVASAGSSNIGVSRTFEFEQLSIASIGRVELSKTPTPDVSGSAMAGVVNLRSKGAFDRKGQQIRWQVSSSINSIDGFRRTPGPDDVRRYHLNPNLTLEYSNLFLKDKLGVIAGFNYSETYLQQKFLQQIYTFDNNPSNNATEVPALTQVQAFDSPKTTERVNYNLRLDYKVNPDLRFWLRGDYNTYDAETYARSVVMTFGGIVNSPIAGSPVDPGVEYSLKSQTARNTTIDVSNNGGAFAKYGATGTYTGGFAYKKGPFSADVQGSVSTATNYYVDLPRGFFFGGFARLTGQQFKWTRDSEESTALNVTQLSGLDWRNLDNYPTPAAGVRLDRASKDQQREAKGDFRYELTKWKIPTLLKSGFNISRSIRHVNRDYVGGANSTYTYLGPDLVANSGDERWSLFKESNYKPGLPGFYGSNLTDLPSLDRFALAQEYEAHPDRFQLPTANQLLQAKLQNHWDTDEKINAAYLQAIFKLTNKLDVAPGVRWEQTKGDARGPNDIGDRAARRALTGSSTGTVDTTSAAYLQARYGTDDAVTQDYDNTLKYLHVNYRPLKNVVMRLSYNDSITRPPLDQLAGGVTIVSELSVPPVARVPNHNLLPEQSRNIAASAELYFRKSTGFVSVSFIRRDIKNLIRNLVTDIPSDGDFEGDEQWAGWRLTTTDNIAKAHVSSLELNYRQNLDFLPGIAQGLAVFANYTRMNYDNFDNFLRPTFLANGGVSFSYRNLFVRWNVNYTPAFRATLYPANGWASSAFLFSPYNGERIVNDLQIDYRLPRGISLFVTGRNIFNENATAFYNSGGRTLQHRPANYGALWTAGIKGTF